MLDFLKAVLPNTGPFCIAFRSKDRKGMIHRAPITIHDLAKTAAWGLRKGWDCYFSISSLKETKWVDEQGKPHIRKKQNCAKTKVFVLDVDIDPESDRKYHTKDEAIVAVRAFVERLGLKDPIIVDSGYGLHVYWLLTKSVDSPDWERLANYFKSIAVNLDQKLAADTSRIADSAGVLRLPGTINFKKQESPQHVKILYWSEQTMDVLEFGKKLKDTAKELRITVVAPKTTKRVNVDLSMDVPHRLDAVIQKCNWTREYIKNISTATEVEWYRMLGLLKHLYHPSKSMTEIAQMFSKGHPGYSWEATEKKFNQVRIAQSGPTFCKTFRDLRPERCAGCPFAVMVTTPARLDEVDLPDPNPLQLQTKYTDTEGRAVVASVEAVPIPKPYFRGKDGGIYMHMDGGPINGHDADPITIRKIYEYDIYPVSRLQNEDSGEEEIEVHLFLPKDGKKVIRVPNQVVIEPKAFAGYLTARGVLLKPHEVQPLVSYMVDYTRVIQKQDSAQGVYTRFGWRTPGETDASFVLGDGVINNEGEFKPCMTANWLVEQKEFASSKGSLSEWTKAFAVVEKCSPLPYQFVNCLAFAAPLFALTPYHGLMFNMLGRSGIGKSTALQFMTSVWGKPTMSHIIKKDNSIPIYNKIGYLNSLPVAYDEITMLPADQTADLAYGVTEGRGKERADRSGQTKINFVKWNTVVVSCSNLSLYEKIGMSKQGNAAPAFRIFETTAPEVQEKNKAPIEAALRVLDGNYGIAGRVYVQYVMKNRQHVINRLIEEEQRITQEFKLRTAERFWGGMFATVSVGVDICSHLSLHGLKKEKMLQWAYDELEHARKSLHETQGNAVNILGDFINTNLHSTLFIFDGKVTAYGLTNTPTRELAIRLEREKGRFTEGYISSGAFKKYCQINKIEYGWIVKDLLDMRAIKHGTHAKRLGAGTEWAGAPISVISLDFSSPYWDEQLLSKIEPGQEVKV